jgi:uncharacterized protein
MATKKRGFAAMDPDQQRRIASKGGKASSGSFDHDPRRAAEAGRKGAAAQPLEAKRRGGANSHRTG